jgi:hypothetical protein
MLAIVRRKQQAKFMGTLKRVLSVRKRLLLMILSNAEVKKAQRKMISKMTSFAELLIV